MATYNTINNDVTMSGDEGTLLAGRYRIVRQLGQGGMGSVWLAEDTQLDNKPFAIKMLPSILVSNKRAYRQLKDEALVAMKLTHTNIVTLRAFEENNGNPFLVMDYIEGQTLDDYLAENGKITEEETVRLLRPIASALDYAHSKGVVHRDVKPGNVMFAKDGTPYILDFGIAREIQETMTRVTGKLSSGTLLYMSPEQLNGAAPKKDQDIYSFSAMAYECLKGEPPFVRGSIEDQIKNKIPDSPVGRGVPTMPLVAGIMAGLAKKPEDRPPTCAAILEGDVSRVERVERVESCDGGARSIGSLGRVVWALALLAALVGGGYYGWTKYDKRVQSRIARENQLVEERIAKLKAEKDVVEAEKRRIEDERVKREKELAEQVAKARKEPRPAAKAGEPAEISLAEQEVRQREVARLAELRVDIGIRFDDAKDKMEKISAYRGEPDGFKAHIDNADAKWKDINALDKQPTTVPEAESSLNSASVAESAIARELQWLKTNKAARDGAKAIEAAIAREIEPEIEKFKVSDYARVMYGEGMKLRHEGNDALANGDFSNAKAKLDAAKSKLADAVSNARKFCIDTHIGLAKKNLVALRWQACIDECNIVLGWDATNADAKKMKAEAKSQLVPSVKIVATLDGREVSGAKLDDGTRMHVMPICWTLEDGKRYGPYEVSYESGGLRYVGMLKDFVARPGMQEFKVNLEERPCPSVHLVATVNGQAKRAYVFEGADKQGVYTPATIELMNTQVGTERKFGVVYAEGGVVYRRIQGYLVKDGRHDFSIEMRPLHKCSSCGRPLPKYLYELKCSHCGYKFMP